MRHQYIENIGLCILSPFYLDDILSKGATRALEVKNIKRDTMNGLHLLKNNALL